MTNDQAVAGRAALAELLGTTDIEVVARIAARLRSGEEVHLVHASVCGEPNRATSLVVDAIGAVNSPRRFEALAGRELFAPESAVPEPPAVLSPQPVTIDPAANDLTLPEYVAEDETITVHAPISGAPPKPDVHLVVDTTGSMTPIIGVIQTGIT